VPETVGANVNEYGAEELAATMTMSSPNTQGKSVKTLYSTAALCVHGTLIRIILLLRAAHRILRWSVAAGSTPWATSLYVLVSSVAGMASINTPE
jgi:hypothetical protein